MSCTPDQAIQNRPDFAAMREAEDGPSRPIVALQFFGRYWEHSGHRDALEPEGSVAKDPWATLHALDLFASLPRAVRSLHKKRVLLNDGIELLFLLWCRWHHW